MYPFIVKLRFSLTPKKHTSPQSISEVKLHAHKERGERGSVAGLVAEALHKRRICDDSKGSDNFGLKRKTFQEKCPSLISQEIKNF